MKTQMLQIAKLLSCNHFDVVKEMTACVADTEYFLREHHDKYELIDGLDGTVMEEDYVCIQWLMLAKCMVQHKIAADLDYKCELEDFAYFVKGLFGKQKYKLTFRTAWFDEEDSIEEWIRILNAKWQPDGICLVQFDVEGDNYIILPILMQDYDMVVTLAMELGQNIYLAGTGKAEDAPTVLIDFSKRHPWAQRTSRNSTMVKTVSCEQCFSGGNVGGCTLCELEQSSLFQIIVRSSKMSSKQLMTLSRHFRLGAIDVRKRISVGKSVYVKLRLNDALMAMKALEQQEIAYEILPYTPELPHYHECTKKFRDRGGNDYKYYLFDRERESEWAAEQ